MIRLIIDLCFASTITMLLFYVFRQIEIIYNDHM
jgi:hypothetical protein